MLIWAEFERSSPQIARLGLALLQRFQFVFVGTLTREGSPRVNPCEAYVVDGHLLLNMMPRSKKALDLLRDPRIYLHSPVTSKVGDEGEFKISGQVAQLTDRRLREELDDLFWSMIHWRPDPDSHYFEVLIQRASYFRYGEDEMRLFWPPRDRGKGARSRTAACERRRSQ